MSLFATHGAGPTRLAMIGLLLCVAPAAQAREPRTAIAPLAVGQAAPAEVQRAFQEELPRALVATGVDLLAPNEVDLRVGERPELLRCAGGGCLAEEAAFLQVRRLVLARLDAGRDGFAVALSLYDAGEKQSVAEAVGRCAPCTAATVRTVVHEVAAKLRTASLQPGTLEVRAAPKARLTVDGRAVGSTPWRGALEPGDHVVALEHGTARVERDVSVSPGRTARVEVALEGAQLQAARAPTRFRVAKWVLLAGGLAAVGVGAGLWAIDGHGTCALSSGQLECPKVYDTIATGATLVGLGGAFLVTSVLMLALDKPLPSVQAGVSATAGGAAVGVTGRF